ncbi:hypothetical protein [Rhabdochlamydiaceae symbiont of Dictyostelium giganteum]|uniref:hypothetical protein n=1 Tax=Rhabdochlamydiaceae symbiont of Dictyostelium giganteum TaxID=3342349 RepID=UPI00384F3EF2
MQHEHLTNEALKKHFHDNFELTQFLIQAARHQIKAGREISLTQLLKDVQKNPTLYAQQIQNEETSENFEE